MQRKQYHVIGIKLMRIFENKKCKPMTTMNRFIKKNTAFSYLNFK